MLIFPHGIYVDRDGNVRVTDGQATLILEGGARPRGTRGAGRRREAGGAEGTSGL